MSRTHFDQLPNKKEIDEILAYEATRTLPEGKENVHYPEFDTFLNLLHAAGIPNEDFLSVEVTDAGGEKMAELIRRLVTKIRNDEIAQEILDELYGYLSEDDELQPADFLLVFGNKQRNRTDIAINLYQEGFAPKIIMSGKGPIYQDDTEESEAEILKQYAVEQGVPEADIITEDQSITIPDNVKRTLNLLDEMQVPYSSIISVMAPFAQRRAWAHLKKYTPESVSIIRANSGLRPQFSADEWYKTEEGIKVVLNEYVKLRVAELLNTA